MIPSEHINKLESEVAKLRKENNELKIMQRTLGQEIDQLRRGVKDDYYTDKGWN